MEIPEDLLRLIKADNRFSTSKLDEVVQAEFETAMAEMEDLGILADVSDPRIRAAVMNKCRAELEKDPDKSAKWHAKYEDQLANLKLCKGHREGGGCSE